MTRILALDIGERRIGVALSDETATIAQPLTVIERESIAKDVERIAQMLRQHAAGEVVVGQPRTLRGEQAQAVHKVQAFVAHLRAVLNVPIALVDERLSTVEADRRMREAEVRRERRRQKVDAVAAALILQRYLAQRGAKENCDAQLDSG